MGTGREELCRVPTGSSFQMHPESLLTSVIVALQHWPPVILVSLEGHGTNPLWIPRAYCTNVDNRVFCAALSDVLF